MLTKPLIKNNNNNNNRDDNEPDNGREGDSSNNNDDQPATRTFEQISLEGSKVRLVCPHAASVVVTPRASSFATATTTHLENAVKQWPGPPGERADLGPDLAAELTNGRQRQSDAVRAGSVKWFRNHVPLLLGPRYFQSSDGRPSHLHHQSFSKRPPRAGRWSSPDGASGDRPPAPAATTTIGLSELAGPAKEGPTNQGADRDDADDNEDGQRADLAIGEQRPSPLAIQRTLPAPAEEGPNVNESEGERKLFNLPTTLDPSPGSLSSEPERALGQLEPATDGWFVNEFGELVISRVSRYFAGKYTCLAAGRQSELMLNVLRLDEAGTEEEEGSGGNHGQQQRLDGSPTDRGESFDRPPADESELAEKFAKETTPEEPDKSLKAGGDYRSGSGRIASGGAESAGRRRPNGSGRGQDPAGKLDRGRAMGSARTRVALEGATLSPLPVPAGTGAGTGGPFGAPPIGQTTTEANSNVGSHRADRRVELEPARRRMRPPLQSPTTTTRPHRRRQIHYVESETVGPAELRFIPGLLYTKQLFHCPVLRSGELNRALDEHLQPIGEQFCRAFDIDSETSPGVGRRCRDLAFRLLKLLARSGCGLSPGELKWPSGSDWCPRSATWPLEVVWFKDGRQLHSDEQTESGLNIKLIDLLDQYKIGNAPDGSARHPGAAGQRWAPVPSGQGSLQDQPDGLRPAPMCPPEGLILEIDGIKKDNAGHYTCALKLSVPKLRQILEALRRRNEGSLAIKWPNCVHDNDISCCDGDGQAVEAVGRLAGSRERSNHFADARNASRPRRQEVGGQPTLIGFEPSRGELGAQQQGAQVAEPSWGSRENNGSDRRAALMESIFNGSAPSERSLNYLERALLDSLKSIPITRLQTFALVVSERPGKLSAGVGAGGPDLAGTRTWAEPPRIEHLMFDEPEPEAPRREWLSLDSSGRAQAGRVFMEAQSQDDLESDPDDDDATFCTQSGPAALRATI